jgi:superfamily II DNA/RNA helicase
LSAGRFIDYVDRKLLTLENVDFLVLDEADRMLDMGFEPQVRRIVHEREMKKERQTLMFSATFPPDVQLLARDFMTDYVWVAVGMVGGACDSIDQDIILIERKQKLDKLTEMLNEDPEGLTIVFSNSKNKIWDIYQHLNDLNFKVGELHGDLDQNQREKSLRSFRDGYTNILIATDVASRGLDIPNVKRVINYDFPKGIDDYVHRIGRTGRIGNKGKAVTFVSPDGWGGIDADTKAIEALADMLKKTDKVVPDWLQAFQSTGRIEKESTQWGGHDVRSGEEGWGSKSYKESWSGGWNDDKVLPFAHI